jgi:uncharacterized phage-associated protein
MFRSLVNKKIGSLLNYMSSKIPNLTMTKALKLLYLIDETAYIRTGVSVAWLDYQVWKMRPVAEELYNELRYDQKLVQDGQPLNLEPYISTKKEATPKGPAITILPKGSTDTSDFSPFEMELIDNIIDRFGSYTGNQLTDLLHEKNTLWHKCVSTENLKQKFELYGNKSKHTIDFSELIADGPILQISSQSAFESMQFQEQINQLQ